MSLEQVDEEQGDGMAGVTGLHQGAIPLEPDPIGGLLGGDARAAPMGGRAFRAEGSGRSRRIRACRGGRRVRLVAQVDLILAAVQQQHAEKHVVVVFVFEHDCRLEVILLQREKGPPARRRQRGTAAE
jgi:hypothetical protein